ncbi:unnamed protein product [Heterotrigona itama]|uniref:Uncharacterized protein n=1 Tax=Heterotrigona itama TaxID=395501 RepID=A0A6V7GZU2_9HYME|nr:unnamed protein product [Heterotrigona itama]
MEIFISFQHSPLKHRFSEKLTQLRLHKSFAQNSVTTFYGVCRAKRVVLLRTSET